MMNETNLRESWRRDESGGQTESKRVDPTQGARFEVHIEKTRTKLEAMRGVHAENA
jgi:hypothetical protein